MTIHLTLYRPGDRVVISDPIFNHAKLSGLSDWMSRRPGVGGTFVNSFMHKGELMYRIEHDEDTPPAPYYPHELVRQEPAKADDSAADQDTEHFVHEMIQLFKEANCARPHERQAVEDKLVEKLTCRIGERASAEPNYFTTGQCKPCSACNSAGNNLDGLLACSRCDGVGYVADHTPHTSAEPAPQTYPDVAPHQWRPAGIWLGWCEVGYNQAQALRLIAHAGREGPAIAAYEKAIKQLRYEITRLGMSEGGNV